MSEDATEMDVTSCKTEGVTSDTAVDQTDAVTDGDKTGAAMDNSCQTAEGTADCGRPDSSKESAVDDTVMDEDGDDLSEGQVTSSAGQVGSSGSQGQVGSSGGQGQEAAEDEDGKQASKSGESDEYYYTKRDEFTSEIYKICITNLPRMFGFAEFKKKLTSLQLKPVKLKCWQRLVFVTFRCEEDREAAIKALDGLKWRQQFIKAQKARPAADPLMRKRKQGEGMDSGSGGKKVKESEPSQDNIPPEERLKNAVAPLWNMPYEKQLVKKSDGMRTFMRSLGKQFEKHCADLRPWLKEQRAKHSYLCCELLDIIPSPKRDKYRNKCEFTIGQGIDGSDTVGFRFGQYSKGSVYVGNAEDVAFLPDIMKGVLKDFQAYLTAGQYRSYNPESHTGNWRQLTIRTSRLGHLMIMADFHPQQLSQEEIEAEKNGLKEYFMNGPGSSSGVTSCYFRSHTERMTGASTENPYQCLFGEEHITESLLGMKFRISPDAFFQVNTDAAELLYQKVADWCNGTKETTVLDLCCGTGTIGQTIAKNVQRVVGVEMCAQAVQDAKKNAAINDISNVDYHCAKAEDIMRQVSRSFFSSSEVVAIVDPPRGGLHSSVVVSIRNCRSVTRLIYVSCNVAGASNNFLDLVRPVSKRLKGPRFYPVKAVPVDLFPDTSHCELVFLFERQQTEEEDSSD